MHYLGQVRRRVMSELCESWRGAFSGIVLLGGDCGIRIKQWFRSRIPCCDDPLIKFERD